MSQNLYRKLAIGFGLGFVVFLGLILYGDIRAVSSLLRGFRWQLMPAILGLTLVNYILRGMRFHYYVRQLGVHHISLWTSFRVFLGGFALTVTPGKVGELIRVVWLKNITGADPVSMAPATIVDRIVDGLAMALLALAGGLIYPQYRPIVLVILSVIIGGVVISQIRPLALWLLKRGETLPLIDRVAHHLHTLYENTYQLLRFKNLTIGTAIGLVSWSSEGVAFYLVLVGLQVSGSVEVALLAIFALALGSILGGVSSLPGGLGAAEATMTGILRLLMGLSQEVAATGTLLIRFFTLWFAVGLGFVVVIIWRNLLFGKEWDLLSLQEELADE